MFDFDHTEFVDLTPMLGVEPFIGKEPNCEECPNKRNPLPPQGEGRKRILVLLSRPTKQEMDRGRYGGSQEFQHIAVELEKQGINIHTDCWVVGAMACSGTLNTKALECCRPLLYDTVQTLRPYVVIAVGRNAMAGWKGHHFRGSVLTPRAPNYNAYKADQAYGMWAGQQIPDAEYGFKEITVDGREFDVRPIVCPVLNAHDVSIGVKQNMERRGDGSAVPRSQERIVGRIAQLVNSILPDPYTYYSNLLARTYQYHPKKHIVVRTVEEAVEACNVLQEENLIAFDYETTGLKPYDKGHKIVMVGIAGSEVSYAIPFFNDSRFQEAYKALMTNPSIRKVAHNIKFENNWTRRICGFRIENVHWDTMIAAHILDMRDGVVGLKMQGYLQFGDAGYEAAVQRLLRPAESGRRKNSNDKNWLQHLYPEKLTENSEAWDTLLGYVAQDAALTYALYYRQQQLFVEKDYSFLMQGMGLFMETSATVSDMEYNGFRFSMEEAEKSMKAITARMEELYAEMLKTAEYSVWEKQSDKPLNFNSPQQMQKFFFDLLGYKPINFTATGAPSVDKDTIERLNTPFTKLLAEYKTLNTVGNTYLRSYMMESNDDGFLRGFIGLSNVRSYRTSSNSPNLQNSSKRGEHAAYLRRTMGPHKGHVLVDMDFSMLEVCVNACESQDPTLMYYVNEPGADMHRDVGGEALFYAPEDLSGYLRTGAKIFVFRGFYGGGPRGGAEGLWHWIGREEQVRLREFGIRNYNDFLNHIYKVHDNMWNVRFPGFTDWKRRT